MTNQATPNSSFTPKNYSNQAYWEYRYQQPFIFDWLEPFETLIPYLNKILTKDAQIKILHVGCGNSELAEEIAKYYNIQTITNIDCSKTVIQFMQEKTKNNYPSMEWITMDVTSVNFKDESYDIIIDKCTCDSLYCYEQPIQAVLTYYKEMYRVLKNGGIMLMISYADESMRMEHLKSKFLQVDVIVEKLLTNFYENERVGQKISKETYIYYIKKKENAVLNEELFNNCLNEIIEKEKTFHDKIN